MPINARKKAQVVKDLIAGMTLKDTSAKHGVSMSTLSKWAREVRKTSLAKPDSGDRFARQKAAFIEQFTEMMAQVVEMTRAQAKVLADPDFIRKQSADELNSYSEGIIRRTERLYRLTQGDAEGAETPPPVPALDPEVIDAEPVS